MDLRTILDHALSYWPEGFRDLHLFEIESLLEEMEGLGVLRRLEDGHYVLRNANVVLLMGTLADIENVLLQPREPPVRYDPKSFLVTRDEEPGAPPFPLTMEQLHRIEAADLVAVVLGCAASGLARVPDCLGAAREAVRLPETLKRQRELRERLDAALRRGADRPRFLVVPNRVPWAWDWLQAARSLLRLRAPAGTVLVFLGDEGTAWRLAEQPEGPGRNPPLVLGPWSDAFLRDWLDRRDWPHDRETVERIRRLTGGWHEVVLEDLGTEPQAHHQLEDLLDQLERADRRHLLARFGLGDPKAPVREGFAALVSAATAGRVAERDLEAAAEIHSVDPADVRRALRWAELLGLAKRDAVDSWRLDPFVCRLLEGTP